MTPAERARKHLLWAMEAKRRSEELARLRERKPSPILALPLSEAPSAVTVREAAKLMSCDSETVRRMIKDGRLEAFRIGTSDTGPLRIRWASLMKQVARSARPAPDPL